MCGARNYLTAMMPVPGASDGSARRYALASLDISTGEFEVGEVAADDLGGELMRLAPGEIIAADIADERLKAAVASPQRRR